MLKPRCTCGDAAPASLLAVAEECLRSHSLTPRHRADQRCCLSVRAVSIVLRWPAAELIVKVVLRAEACAVVFHSSPSSPPGNAGRAPRWCGESEQPRAQAAVDVYAPSRIGTRCYHSVTGYMCGKLRHACAQVSLAVCKPQCRPVAPRIRTRRRRTGTAAHAAAAAVAVAPMCAARRPTQTWALQTPGPQQRPVLWPKPLVSTGSAASAHRACRLATPRPRSPREWW
jgi:hypothetical protein